MINPKIYFDTDFLTQHNPYFVLVIYTNTLHRHQQHKIYKLEIKVYLLNASRNWLL